MFKKRSKAKKFEEKGDKARAKQKTAEALKHYEAALSAEPKNPALIEKLIQTQAEQEEPWDLDAFTKHLDWTLQEEKLANPELEYLHQQLSPEYEQLLGFIERYALADEAESQQLATEILKHGAVAVLPLLHFIRTKAQRPG